jgi:hypothetical protein
VKRLHKANVSSPISYFFFRFYCESSFFLFTFLRSDQFAHWIIDVIGQRIPPFLLTNRLPNAVNDVVYCPPGLQQREKMPSERGHVITGKPSRRRNRFFFFERPNRTNKNVYITPLSCVYIWVIWSFPFFLLDQTWKCRITWRQLKTPRRSSVEPLKKKLAGTLLKGFVVSFVKRLEFCYCITSRHLCSEVNRLRALYN